MDTWGRGFQNPNFCWTSFTDVLLKYFSNFCKKLCIKFHSSLQAPESMGMSVEDDNKVLKVDLMSQDHAGIYKCIASGTDGGVNVAFAKVDVYGKKNYY